MNSKHASAKMLNFTEMRPTPTASLALPSALKLSAAIISFTNFLTSANYALRLSTIELKSLILIILL
jgi:hypothetical protein